MASVMRCKAAPSKEVISDWLQVTVGGFDRNMLNTVRTRRIPGVVQF